MNLGEGHTSQSIVVENIGEVFGQLPTSIKTVFDSFTPYRLTQTLC